jgi:hypothetical protein
LVVELEADRTLAEQRFGLVEGMDHQRAALRGPALACRQGIGIAVAAHHEVGAVRADAPDLGRRGNRRHEDLGWHAQPHRRISHGGAVIATGRRHHAGLRHLAGEQVHECTARLEAAGMLQLLELQQHLAAGEPGIDAVDPDHRCLADIGRDAPVGGDDGRLVDCLGSHNRHVFLGRPPQRH